MTDDLGAVEADLKELFAVVAAALPGAAPLEWEEYRTRVPQSTSRWRRLGRRARLVLVGTVAIGLAGAGTGSAAAGAFSPPRPVKVTYGSAQTLLPPRGFAPNEVIRYVGPGPDGFILTVVSASSHPNSGCIGLVIAKRTAPSNDQAITGSCMASGNVNRPLRTTSRPWTTDYDDAQYGWKSPTGTTYVIWYGKAPAGTVAFGVVGLVAGNGPRPVLGRKYQTRDGFYALAIPHKLGDAVGFYNASGQVFTTVGGTAGHGGTTRAT